MQNRWFRLVLPGGVLWAVLCTSAAAQTVGLPPPTRVTIHAPEPRSYDLSLSEIELDWSGVAESERPSAATTVGEAVVRMQSGARAELGVGNVSDVAGLRTLAQQHEAANPGARAELVVYEAGQPPSAGTRAVITRRVVVLLQSAAAAQAFETTWGSSSPRPLRAPAHAYTLDADDSLAAVALADRMRAQPGVKTAYVLLRKQQGLR